MADLHDQFTDHIAFDPDEDFETFLKKSPARWVVYLLADEHDRPVQLLCVKNLRYSLKRRLGGEEQIGLSKRVNYRDLVRHVYWRRVDSALEADLVYLEAARAAFPQTYQGMVGFRPAWFVHVDPETNFPRYTKTIDLAKRGQLIGPVEDKHAAANLIELIEDSFDLCRYYNILVQAPNAKACAYKEMGKCPAPCDGSISMPQYRRMMQWSSDVAVEKDDFVREQTKRMQAAATELKFESAARIKAYVDEVSQFGKGPYRHVARLENFVFLALQRGPREGTAKVFLITPTTIEEIAGLIDEPLAPADLLRHVLGVAAGHSGGAMSKEAQERIGVVAHHLFISKQAHGVFLRTDRIDEKSLAKGYRDLRKQKAPETSEIEAEGVVKELQAMGEAPADATAT